MLDQKAKELGRLIGQSDQYKALKRANESLGRDAEAVQRLTRMEALRTEAQRLLESGQEPTEDMEREMDELLGKVQVSGVYQQVIAAQENYDKLMMKVNAAISEGIKAGAESSIITLG